MEETELVDIWRFQHPEDKLFTWHRKNPSNIFCRLDFFLTSFGLSEKIESSDIKYGYKSDHSLIIISYIPYQSVRGKGLWKLNCKHLKDPEYVNRIKQVISETAVINREANPNILWDTIKLSIRGESIKFGARKKKLVNNEIKKIEDRNEYLYQLINQCNNNDNDILEEIELNKGKIEKLVTTKIQGAIIRSRIKWYEEGEKNSSYFFNLEKRTANMKSINRLQLNDGSITQNHESILKEMEIFYQSLYKSSKPPMTNNTFDKIKNDVKVNDND